MPDFEKLRKIGLSQVAAAKRSDASAVVKWAARALAEALPEPEPEIVESIPGAVLTNWAAASLDAGFVVRASLGADEAELKTNPAPGAAKALGFCGVIGTGTGGELLFATFVDGVLVTTSTSNPGAGPDGFSVRFGLVPGINPDAPYTGAV